MFTFLLKLGHLLFDVESCFTDCPSCNGFCSLLKGIPVHITVVVVTTSFSKDIDQEMTVISWSLLVGKAMTETEKAVLRIQSVLHHLKAVNQQQLTVREQEVLTDVITSACERVAYFVQQDGSVAFRSLSQRLQSYDRSQLLPFRQKEAILSGSAVRYDSTGNGDGNKNRADTKE